MGVPSDGAALRRVTLRAPVRDPLLARQRLERALASLDWAPPGLPRRALLLVRRLVATGQRAPALGRSIAESLQAQAREARRPWVDGAAGSCGAVWFADDDELAACLLREWLRGHAQEPWWTRAALGDESLPRWLARRVTSQGDRLVAVIAQLASAGLAASWVARLDDAMARASACAIARDHAAPAVADALVADAREGISPHIPPDRMHAKAAASILARIAAAVPELRDAHLAPVPARLLAVALVAARDPGLLRSQGFAQVVQGERLSAVAQSATRISDAARRPVPTIEDGPGEIERTRATTSASGRLSGPHAAETSMLDSTPRDASTRHRPPARDAGARAPATSFDDIAATPLARRDDSAPASPRAVPHETATDQREGPHQRPAAPKVGHAPNDAIDGALPAASRHVAGRAAQSLPPALASSSESRTIETSFGGLFYLLNAAIGLGLYGDFTAPDQPGIALSPWALLGVAGNAWFARAFARDALAHWLARTGGAEPPDPRPRAWAVPDIALHSWGEVGEVRYRATARRLRLHHPAGFVLFDVPRSGAAPAAQAAALCRDRVLLARASVRVDGGAPGPSRDRWRDWLLPLLRARLALALGAADDQALLDEVCRAQARVTTRPAWVDVRLSLAALPVAIRLAGLDRDPGWIPAAGRDVRFHFE